MGKSRKIREKGNDFPGMHRQPPKNIHAFPDTIPRRGDLNAYARMRMYGPLPHTGKSLPIPN